MMIKIIKGITTDAVVEIKDGIVSQFTTFIDFCSNPSKYTQRVYSAQKLDMETYTEYRKMYGREARPYYMVEYCQFVRDAEGNRSFVDNYGNPIH